MFFYDIIKFRKAWIISGNEDRSVMIVRFGFPLIVESVMAGFFKSFFNLGFDVFAFMSAFAEKMEELISTVIESFISGAYGLPVQNIGFTHSS